MAFCLSFGMTFTFRNRLVCASMWKKKTHYVYNMSTITVKIWYNLKWFPGYIVFSCNSYSKCLDCYRVNTCIVRYDSSWNKTHACLVIAVYEYVATLSRYCTCCMYKLLHGLTTNTFVLHRSIYVHLLLC